MLGAKKEKKEENITKIKVNKLLKKAVQPHKIKKCNWRIMSQVKWTKIK
jgi:hypothetical protein